jgi:rod shape-determining protein MreB
MEVTGRSLIEGIPKTITVDDSEIREALNECVAAVVSAIRVALERTPPELCADISDRGIVLAGGGALLRNLDRTGTTASSARSWKCDDFAVSEFEGRGDQATKLRATRQPPGLLIIKSATQTASSSASSHISFATPLERE